MASPSPGLASSGASRRGRPRKHPVPLTRRRRGAQPGNRNRWRHGRYSAQAHAGDLALKAEIAAVELRLAEALAWHACETAEAEDRANERPYRPHPSTVMAGPVPAIQDRPGSAEIMGCRHKADDDDVEAHRAIPDHSSHPPAPRSNLLFPIILLIRYFLTANIRKVLMLPLLTASTWCCFFRGTPLAFQ